MIPDAEDAPIRRHALLSQDSISEAPKIAGRRMIGGTAARRSRHEGGTTQARPV